MRPAPLPIARLLLCCVCSLLFSSSVRAQEILPGELESRIARNIFKALPEQHLLKVNFDQSMAEAALDDYFTQLDSWKLNFWQQDIDEFQARKANLAEQLHAGNVTLIFDIYKRLLQRITEAEVVWKDLLRPGQLEFDTLEMVVISPKDRHYATDAEIFREQWRTVLKYQLLSKKVDPERKAVQLDEACKELLADRLRRNRHLRILKSQEVLGYFLTSATALYDRNTIYTSPLQRENADILNRGNLTGIGMAISADLSVSSIIKGGPAEKANQFQPGDLIVGVGQGASGPLINTTPLTLAELVALIRGPEGSTVRVSIKRDGEANPRTVTLTRARVTIPQAKVESRVMMSGPCRIGYIEVPSFYRDAAPNDNALAAVTKAVEAFKQQMIDVVMLDLRNCTGGYLDQTLNITGAFVGKGKIYQSRNQKGELLTTENDSTAMLWNKPLVVLVSRATASGAEILSAAVQDYRRGLIIGDDITNGHGLIGTLNDLPENTGMLKVTTGRFYRVNGTGIQKLGVTPDILVPSAAVVEDRAVLPPSRFEVDSVAAISSASQSMLPAETMLKLRAQSRERRLRSSAFEQVQDAIDWKRSQTAATVVSLREDQFLARWRESPVPKLKELPSGDNDIFLKEACAITAEYVELVGSKLAGSIGTGSSASTGTPMTSRQQTLANQAEEKRQALEQAEEKLQRVQAQVSTARSLVDDATTARDAAPADSAKRKLAEQALLQATAALTKLQADADKLQAELGPAPGQRP